MHDQIDSIETFPVHIKNNNAIYSANFETDNALEKHGYRVEPVNGTIYPLDLKSVLVRVTTKKGVVGWGETYGLCAAGAIEAIHKDILEPFLQGRDPLDAQIHWEDMYNLMRVRGYSGFYLDAIAAVDIALWDICGKIMGVPTFKLLGGQRRKQIPAYISGLSGEDLDERVALAKSWVEQGFDAIKVHSNQTNDIDAELSALRKALGTEARLMVDLHWRYTAAEAANLIAQWKKYRLSFVEAPCKPEDLRGIQELSKFGLAPVAVGEEWRTVFDAAMRINESALAFVQPEMGHTGITQFMRIAQLAQAYHIRVAPHATIGCGIFLAASLHASTAINDLPFHEYQPNIFKHSKKLIDGVLEPENGHYQISNAPGLGVEPRPELLDGSISLS